MNSPDSCVEKITVYIPAYNAAEFLGNCIEALLKQTLPPEEILVIDDGSSDDCARIASRYAEVTLLQHGENRGLAAARNTAVRAARCDLIASIDADCVAAPTWMAELCLGLCDSDFVGAGGKLIEGVQKTIADRWRAVHMPQHWGDSTLRGVRYLFGSNNLFRRSALIAVGGYNEKMRTNGEDIDICTRLRENNGRFLYLPAAKATHLRHDTTKSILETHWRWWRFGVNAYANGARLRSVIGHAIFVHFRYNFFDTLKKDIRERRWKLAAFDFLILLYFPYRDFRLWLSTKS